MPLLGTIGVAASRGFGFLTSVAAAVDEYFKYVTLLLHGNGTNGAQNNTFLDSSTNNFTITRNGNTTQGTFTPYGSNWSNYFDGSGDYLSISNTTALDLPADFTIELWWCPMSLSGTQSLFGKWGSSQFAWLVQATSSNIILQTGTGGGGASVTTISNAWSPTVGQWYHLAFTRSGTDIKAYVNGSQVGTTQTSSRTCSSTATTAVGANPDGPQEFSTGYISNARVVKGTAVYAGAFTPSTSPLTAISGTSLLTCQSNRFIDNSSNNFTITRNGDVSVQRFSPFAPTAPYSTSVIGGSGYFDGSGDWITAPDSTAFTFGTGDFTVECWVFTGTSATQCVGGQGDSSGTRTSRSFLLYASLTGNPYFTVGYSGNNSIDLTSSSSLPLNQWNHIAGVRDGSTLRLYLNGVQVATGNISTASVNDSANAMTVGRSGDFNGEYLTGYCSNFRVLKGTCLYPSGTTFTPSTSPLTAITNTSLLLNFTNGGIIDNAMMNDLETVGNAQISTSVSKFGGGSIYLDGTGDWLITSGRGGQWAFGTGNATVECWVNTTQSSTGVIASNYDSGSGTVTDAWRLIMGQSLAGYPQWTQGSTVVASGPSAINDGNWHHVAAVISGGQVRIYVDGVGGTPASLSGYNYTKLTDLYVGAYFASGFPVQNPFTGYIDDLRITKAARYTANFTPPSAPFPDK